MAAEAATVAELKTAGVKMFKQRRYKDAVKKFTLAIDLNEPNSEKLKALCHNYRAASKEYAGRANKSALIADVSAAISLDASYGKAYARRYRYYTESSRWSDALPDLFAVQYLEAFGAQWVGKEMNKCLDKLVEQARAEWLAEISANGGERPVPVEHEKLQRWLTMYCRDDGIFKDFHSYQNGLMRDEGTYTSALRLLSENRFDEIVTLVHDCEGELGGRAAECWLLAARILCWKCSWKKCVKCLSLAAPLIAALPNGDRKHGLRVAAHVIRIEGCQTVKDVKTAWRAAVAFSPATPDFYNYACNRLRACDDMSSANEVIHDPRINNCDTIEHQRGQMARAMGHRNPFNLSSCEDRVRSRGLLPYPVHMLATELRIIGHTEEAAALVREAAHKTRFSAVWNDVAQYATSTEERRAALKKSLALDPDNLYANLSLARQQLEDCGVGLLSKSEGAITLSHVQRALSTFDPSEDNNQLKVVLEMLHIIQAKIRAAEMVGFE